MNETPSRNQSMGKNINQSGKLIERGDSQGPLETVGDKGRSTDGDVRDKRRHPSPTLGEVAPDRGAGVSSSLQGSNQPGGPLGQMHRLIEKAGEQPFPDDVIRILSEPIDDSYVDVRPDGLVYVSHVHYRDRLDRAFGVGGWALVPLSVPKVSGNRVLYYGFLKARGQYVADAIGGHDYWPQNRQGTFDNSAEAAKSDCLVRCCKALPLFRECWDKEYADYWLATYAYQIQVNTPKPHMEWRKRGAIARNFNTKPGKEGESEYTKPPRIEDENNAHMAAIKSEGKLRITSRDAYNEHEEGYGSDEELARQYEEAQAVGQVFYDDSREE